MHKNSLEIPQFAFNQHHYCACVYPSRTQESALATEHTLVHLLVRPLILASSHQGVDLAKIKRGEVSRRATCRTGTATDTRLQLRQLADNLHTLAEIVAIYIYYTRF